MILFSFLGQHFLNLPFIHSFPFHFEISLCKTVCVVVQTIWLRSKVASSSSSHLFFLEREINFAFFFYTSCSSFHSLLLRWLNRQWQRNWVYWLQNLFNREAIQFDLIKNSRRKRNTQLIIEHKNNNGKFDNVDKSYFILVFFPFLQLKILICLHLFCFFLFEFFVLVNWCQNMVSNPCRCRQCDDEGVTMLNWCDQVFGMKDVSSRIGSFSCLMESDSKKKKMCPATVNLANLNYFNLSNLTFWEICHVKCDI